MFTRPTLPYPAVAQYADVTVCKRTTTDNAIYTAAAVPSSCPSVCKILPHAACLQHQMRCQLTSKVSPKQQPSSKCQRWRSTTAAAAARASTAAAATAAHLSALLLLLLLLLLGQLLLMECCLPAAVHLPLCHSSAVNSACTRFLYLTVDDRQAQGQTTTHALPTASAGSQTCVSLLCGQCSKHSGRLCWRTSCCN
jgi:hypothetical protein